MAYRIFVVDDDPNIRNACSQSLKLDGYEVADAPGVDPAIQMFKPGLFDMILSDVQMPPKLGFDLLKEVRRQDTNCLFILMTANPNSTDMVKATKEWGANGYLIKPFDTTQLSKLVKQYFRLYEIKKGLTKSAPPPAAPPPPPA